MSTNDSGDFFGKIAYGGGVDNAGLPEGVQRDRWQRPLILAPDGSGELLPYTRASSMSGYISDTFGLHTWQQRLLAQGMGHRPDLAAWAASFGPYDSLSAVDKKDLQAIVDAALEVAKAYEKANWGSAVHGFTDPRHPSGPVPEEMAPDVRSHTEVIESTGIVRLASEVFVVNDELQVAGTLDGIEGIPAIDALVISDTKTGKQDLHKTVIQIAIYRDSQVYDPATGQRTPLHEYVSALHPTLQLPLVHEKVGLYVHIPRGEGKTTLHPLNLDRGREMARICAAVRDWHRSKDFVKDDTTESLVAGRNKIGIEALLAASTLEELKAAAARFKWCWSDRLEAVARTRWEEIGRPTA